MTCTQVWLRGVDTNMYDASQAVCVPQPATAQTGGDLALGYSFLSNDQLAANASSLPGGWFFDTAVQVNDALSIAFDINGHYKRNIEASSVFSGGGDQPVVTPLAGVAVCVEA